MRRMALIGLVFLAVVCLSLVTFVHSLDSIFLNKNYLTTKLEEHNLYQKLIDSMAESSDENALGIKGFIEVIGIEKIKTVINGAIESTLDYLKNPSVNSIEFGLPKGLSPFKTTVSMEDLLPRESMEFLKQAKTTVQTILLIRDIGLIIVVGSLALIVIVARGIKAKIKWVGYSFLAAGLLVFILSLLMNSFAVNALDTGFSELKSLEAGLGALLKSLVNDYFSLVQLYGIAFLLIGVVLLIFSVFLVSRLLKSRKEKSK